MFVWSEPQKKRTYYKIGLVTPVSVTFEQPARQSRYEPETYLVASVTDIAKVRAVEKALIKEVAHQNEGWFKNALTVKQVAKRFTSDTSLSDHGVTLDAEPRGSPDTIPGVELRGVRIFKNHWTPIWVEMQGAEGNGKKGGMEEAEVEDHISIDHGDMEDLVERLDLDVTETKVDILATIRSLHTFMDELEGALERVREAGSSTVDLGIWQQRVDEVDKKLSLYRSGIILFKNAA